MEEKTFILNSKSVPQHLHGPFCFLTFYHFIDEAMIMLQIS